MTSPVPGIFFCEVYNKFGDVETACKVGVREPVVEPPKVESVVVTRVATSSVSPVSSPPSSTSPQLMKAEPEPILLPTQTPPSDDIPACLVTAPQPRKKLPVPLPTTSLASTAQTKTTQVELKPKSNAIQRPKIPTKKSFSSPNFGLPPLVEKSKIPDLNSAILENPLQVSPILQAVAAFSRHPPLLIAPNHAAPPVIQVIACRSDLEAIELRSEALLVVNVSGDPAPCVSWWFSEKELIPSSKYKITSKGEQHICQISDIQMPDVGVYTIMALNPAGKALATLVLRVKPGSEKKKCSSASSKGKRPTKIPSKSSRPKHRRNRLSPAEEIVRPSTPTPAPPSYPVEDFGSDLENEVEKRVDDEPLRPVVPSLEVVEAANENQLELNVESEKNVVIHEAESIRPNDNIRNARRPSNLEESLLAPSPGSSSLSRRPSFKESPAHIIKGPDNLTILQGGHVILRVHYIGNPAPTVRWSKGGRPVEANCRIKMEMLEGTSTVTINDLECDDSGKYVVVVENEHGSDCHFASVSVEGPPEPPADCPNVADVKATSVTLSWYGSMYDGGSIITGYIVEMKRPEEKSWQTVTSNCHSTSFKVRHLVPGNEFMFRIRAQNVHGVSAPSKESEPVYTPLENEDTAEHREVAIEKIKSFRDDYSLEEEIGKGRFGTVHRVIERATGLEYAAKIVKCIKGKNKEAVREEIEIMNLLDHPKLLQLVGAFESPREIVMVLEYVRGGELFERVVADDFHLTEKECILFMRQICEGVRYMHEKSVIHLDLKPENILCLSRTTHRVKLIDFGLARRYNPKTPMQVMFGTPEFVAPEIINYETITPMTDMWSVGVVCYILLSGLSPFMGENDAETFTNITRSEFDFDDEAFDKISKEAKQFINALLVKKQEKRMTAESCLRHHWLAQHERTMSTLQLDTSKLAKFLLRRKWQKTGNAIRALGRMVSLSGLSSRRSSWASSRGSGSQSESETSSTISSPSRFCKEPSITESEGEAFLGEDVTSSDPGSHINGPHQSSPKELDHGGDLQQHVLAEDDEGEKEEMALENSSSPSTVHCETLSEQNSALNESDVFINDAEPSVESGAELCVTCENSSGDVPGDSDMQVINIDELDERVGNGDLLDIAEGSSEPSCERISNCCEQRSPQDHETPTECSVPQNGELCLVVSSEIANPIESSQEARPSVVSAESSDLQFDAASSEMPTSVTTAELASSNVSCTVVSNKIPDPTTNSVEQCNVTAPVTEVCSEEHEESNIKEASFEISTGSVANEAPPVSKTLSTTTSNKLSHSTPDSNEHNDKVLPPSKVVSVELQVKDAPLSEISPTSFISKASFNGGLMNGDVRTGTGKAPVSPESPPVTTRFGVVLRKSKPNKDNVTKNMVTPTAKKPNVGCPLFVKSLLETKTVKAGNLARLEVQVDGRPKPQVQWFKDNQPLYEDRRHKIVQTSDGTTTVMILNAGSEDQALYKCVASSITGSAASSCQLVVVPK